MAGLYAPLPTLRSHPRGGLRTDRGRRGLLLLHRSGLSPHTPCRSPGALTRVAACTLARSPIRDRYPKASGISSPPCLLRLLPAGANRPVGLAPTGKAPPCHGARGKQSFAATERNDGVAPEGILAGAPPQRPTAIPAAQWNGNIGWICIIRFGNYRAGMFVLSEGYMVMRPVFDSRCAVVNRGLGALGVSGRAPDRQAVGFNLATGESRFEWVPADRDRYATL